MIFLLKLLGRPYDCSRQKSPCIYILSSWSLRQYFSADITSCTSPRNSSLIARLPASEMNCSRKAFSVSCQLRIISDCLTGCPHLGAFPANLVAANLSCIVLGVLITSVHSLVPKAVFNVFGPLVSSNIGGWRQVDFQK